MKGKLFKRTLAAATSVLMLTGGVSGLPFAGIFEHAAITASAVQDTITYIDANGTSQTCQTYTTVANSTTAWSDGWYVVSSSTDIADRISVSGTVNLILCDGVQLTCGKGITVEGENSLNIFAQSTNEDTMGKLIANAESASYCAGIGGGDYGSGGEITISGGTVTATGGNYGAGIGGGSSGAGGTIELGWTNATDSIHASSYGGTVIIAAGKVFTDGKLTFDSSTSSETLSALSDAALTPAGAQSVTVTASAHGTVTAPAKAFADETVTLTVTHEAGYVLKSLTVKDADDNVIAVENNQFTMPSNDVTITAEFGNINIIAAENGTITAKIGETAQFTVDVTGSGYTYQWQCYNATTKKWVKSGMAGNTTATLSVDVTASRNGQKYRCFVTDAYGASAYSNAATLKVKTTITTQPNGINTEIGTAAKFTVTATGAGLTYQWQYNKGDGWKTSNATGSKTNTLTINTAAAYNGYKYRCVITDANGVKTYSSVATLKVKTAITGQPASLTKPIGEAAQFTVTATGVGLTYQWQYNKGDGWKTSNASGSTTATLTINTAAGYNGYNYRCVITNANGAKTYSSAATLKVKTTITTQPNGINTAIGTTAKFTVAATGAGLTYQWQYNSGSEWKNSGAAGAATDTLTINAKATYNGWQYRCIVTGENGSVTSSAATLTVS
jgi:hypothetical protein